MRILTISTERIDGSRRGGAIRIDALHRVLRLQGWTTRHLAVYRPDPDAHDGDGPAAGEGLFPLDEADLRRLGRGGSGAEDAAEIDWADLVLADTARFEAVCRQIDACDPDVIWLERPWLWPLVRAHRAARPGARARIVYGAADVEADPAAIETRRGPDGAEERARIRALEDDLCRACDGIVVTSPGDLAYVRAYGKPAVLAVDGVWPKGRRGGAGISGVSPERHASVLYVGSDRPRNAAGFVALLGPDLAYLAPDERIQVAGRAMRRLEAPGAFPAHRGFNLSRILDAGEPDDDALADLIDRTHGLILPVTGGTGSSLKAAEALYSRRPLVATTAALRGYEAFAAFPGIALCDEPAAFRAAVKALLARPPGRLPDHTPEQVRALDGLLWPAALAAVGPFLAALAGTERSALLAGPASARADAVETLTGHGLRPLLARGWHAFEPGGTWSCERIAVLRLTLPEAAYLRAHVEVYNPMRRTLDLDVFTPSGHRATHRFSGGDRIRALAIPVNEADLDAEGRTEIYFRSSALFSPVSGRTSPDLRLLGFRVTALDIARAPLAGGRPRGMLSGLLGRLR